MSSFKVFQADAQDFYLEPSKYEKSSSARIGSTFQVVMKVDWFIDIKNSVALTYLTESSDSVKYKWNNGVKDMHDRFKAHFLAGTNYSLQHFGRNGVGSTSLAQSKVNLYDELSQDYTKSTNTGETQAKGGRHAHEQITDVLAQVLAETIWSDENTSKLRLLSSYKIREDMKKSAKDITNTSELNRECLGHLINLDNIQQILKKLYETTGVFTKDPLGDVIFNGKLDVAQQGNSDNVEYILNDGDELVFPVNIKNIRGGGCFMDDLENEDLEEYRINIIFKQHSEIEELLDMETDLGNFLDNETDLGNYVNTIADALPDNNMNSNENSCYDQEIMMQISDIFDEDNDETLIDSNCN